jgi:hypothetical protein
VSRSHVQQSLVVALLFAASSVPLGAQDSAHNPARDTTRRDTTPRVDVRIQPNVSIARATVVAFAPSLPDSADSTALAWAAVVRGLGFALLLSQGPPPVVIDKRYNSMHFTPLNVAAGFVLVVPGARSHLIQGLIPADSLDREIRAYLASVRPFSR